MGRGIKSWRALLWTLLHRIHQEILNWVRYQPTRLHQLLLQFNDLIWLLILSPSAFHGGHITISFVHRCITISYFIKIFRISNTSLHNWTILKTKHSHVEILGLPPGWLCQFNSTFLSSYMLNNNLFIYRGGKLVADLLTRWCYECLDEFCSSLCDNSSWWYIHLLLWYSI